MARTSSSTRARTKVVEAEAPVTDTPEAIPAEVSTDEAEEAPVSTDTVVEAPVEETVVSDTTESATEATTPEQDEKAKANAEAEAAFENFQASVTTAVANRDESTGDVPEVSLEDVKAKFRELSGAKFKKRANDFLNNKLKDYVGDHDIVAATALMKCIDATKTAGPAKPSGAQADRKPLDPAEAYRDKLTAVHLAYNLVREDAPEGIDIEAAREAVEAAVGGGLLDQAASYYAWVQSTAEDKGDEPEVDAVVKRAVKLAMGKGVGGAGRPRSASTGERAPRTGGNRNVLTHIEQAFVEDAAGTSKRISVIANTKTAEYPDGDCSPGAISARFKGSKPVTGFKMETDDQGKNVITKL